MPERSVYCEQARQAWNFVKLRMGPSRASLLRVEGPEGAVAKPRSPPRPQAFAARAGPCSPAERKRGARCVRDADVANTQYSALLSDQRERQAEMGFGKGWNTQRRPAGSGMMCEGADAGQWSDLGLHR
eukprot:5675878-Pleurochrysis_carterae.AAC.5